MREPFSPATSTLTPPDPCLLTPDPSVRDYARHPPQTLNNVRSPIGPVVLSRPFGVTHRYAERGELGTKRAILLEKCIVTADVDEQRGDRRGRRREMAREDRRIPCAPCDGVTAEDGAHERPQRRSVPLPDGAEIGRASCRERGEVWGGGGSGRYKRLVRSR